LSRKTGERVVPSTHHSVQGQGIANLLDRWITAALPGRYHGFWENPSTIY